MLFRTQTINENILKYFLNAAISSINPGMENTWNSKSSE